jgi:hypothetical protein
LHPLPTSPNNTSVGHGKLVEWSPFPIFPAYGKLLGKMSKKKDLHIYSTRIEGDFLQVQI